MPKIDVVGEIHAISYLCVPYPNVIGICPTAMGQRYRHQWDHNQPMLGKEVGANPEKFHILCPVAFHDSVFISGIADYGGDHFACDYIPETPKQLAVVGKLDRIELRDPNTHQILPKVVRFEGAVLCVSRTFKHLFIVPEEDLGTYVIGTQQLSPEESLGDYTRGSRSPTPALANPVVHANPIVEDPDLAALLKFNNDTVLNSLLSCEQHLVESTGAKTTSGWCSSKHLRLAASHGCQEGLEHAVSAGRDDLATKYQAYREEITKQIDNPNLAQVREIRNRFRHDFFPETEKDCPGSICAHDRLAPNPHSLPEKSVATMIPPSGLTMWGSPLCDHCRRTKEAFQKTGVPYTYIDVTDPKNTVLVRSHGVLSVPLIEEWKGGQVSREHLGEMNSQQIVAFQAGIPEAHIHGN